MKHRFCIFNTLLALSLTAFGQYPDITVTADCQSGASGVYTFHEMVNAKPAYRQGPGIDCSTWRTQSDCDATQVFQLSWDGSKWQLSYEYPCVWLVSICIPTSANGESSPTIIAVSTANTPIPPCYGWTAAFDGCIPVLESGCQCNETLSKPTSPSSYVVDANSVVVKWTSDPVCSNDATVRYRENGDTKWKFFHLPNYVDTASLTNLKPNTTYEWRVLIKNDASLAPLSETAQFTTPCGKPRPAANLSSYAGTGGQVVKWSSPDCADKAVVRYRRIGESAWKFAIVSPYKDSAVVAGLQPMSDYEWAVQLEYNAEKSLLSARENFTTDCTTEPTAALNLESLVWLDDQQKINATLSWWTPACESDLATVRYRQQGEPTWKFQVVDPYTDSTVLRNLPTGTAFEWRVQIKDNGIAGPLSNTAFFDTPAFRLNHQRSQTNPVLTGVTPNPFGDNLTISLNLTADETVKIELMDLQGRLIDLIQNKKLQQGPQQVQYTNSTLQSGVYMIRITAGDHIENHRLLKQ